MRNFKYNHKRNRFRSNGDRSIKNNHTNKDNFHFIDSSDHKRRNFSKQNQNCLKLIDKYNDLGREALSKGDKITCVIFGIDSDRERISLKLSE